MTTKLKSKAERVAMGNPPVEDVRDIDALTEHPKNSKKHSPEQVARLVASVEEFGPVWPILINEKNQILAHTGVWLAYKARGMSKVKVLVARNWPPARQRAYIIADNRLAELSTWDKEILGRELADLKSAGFDIDLLGFKASDVQSMIDRLVEIKGDPENVPKPPAVPVSRGGDLWMLGKHRVFCGDSTSEFAVKAALNGETADLCLTDPPYGVGVKYSGFDDTEKEVARIAKLWVPLARAHSKVTVFSTGVTRAWLYPAPDWVIGWFYAAGQLSSAWGFSCHQPFLCYGKDPSLATGHGRRADAKSHIEIAHNWVDMNTPAKARDINHPCPKPVSLWQWLFQRLTFSDGELVFDPFLGAGTTIIVAEMEHRRCAGIELDPIYVDVIVERWQNFTGRAATLESTGKTFEEMRKARHGKETGRRIDKASVRAARRKGGTA